MLKTVKNAINKYNMFDGVGTVTVALSGGADSVSLLHALLCLKNEYGIKVEAAHLNHGIRGEEADRDEAFVNELCQKLGVKLYCERADVPSVAKISGESLELAARKVRYEFLKRVSADVIATAHTANDNIETVLFNMSRGTGLDGLCGIPPKRDNIIRPLIFVTRRQVEQYCAENSLSYCTDSTNSDDVYSRNRIRHKVVPELETVNSGAVGNVSRMCRTLTEDADFIRRETQAAFERCFENGGLAVSVLNEYHPSIRTRCIAMLHEQQTGCAAEAVHIEATCRMLNDNAVRTSIKGDFEATIRHGILRFEKKSAKDKTEAVEISAFPFSTDDLNFIRLSAEEYKNLYKFNNLLLKSAMDYDKICGKLTLRHRKPGDSIKLCGRNVTKTLKKLFNESDLSQSQRENLKVLCDEQGAVWVENFGIDERVSIDENTNSVIMISKP